MAKKTEEEKSGSQEELIKLRGFLSFLILHEINQEKQTGELLAINIGKRKGKILTPGTIYPALKKLRKKNLVEYSQDGRKKIYRLTEKGKKELDRLYSLFQDYFGSVIDKIQLKE